MKKKITRFAIHKTAASLSLIHVFLGLVFGAITLIAIAAQGQSLMIGILMLLLLPIVYGVMGYSVIALFCWIYNLIAQKGSLGIVFEAEEVE